MQIVRDIGKIAPKITVKALWMLHSSLATFVYFLLLNQDDSFLKSIQLEL